VGDEPAQVIARRQEFELRCRLLLEEFLVCLSANKLGAND